VTDHVHDLVVVTEADPNTAYDYCRTCTYRSESYDTPPELLPVASGESDLVLWDEEI
jgi:hypothetical protein